MKKKTVIALAVAAGVLVLAGVGFALSQDTGEPAPLAGGDRDEHECIGSAGYSWCEKKQKCLRMWEEACNPETKIGYITRFYERDGRRYLDFDEVKWLSVSDGTCVTSPNERPGVPMCNNSGFLIVNDDATSEAYDVVVETVLLTSDFEFGEDGRGEIGYDDFVLLSPDHFAVTPYDIETENDRIFAIRERYVP